MKPKTLFILALLVAALAAFIAFYERDLPGSDERGKLEKRVFRVEADDVVGLEIEWDGATVRLERAEKAAAPGGASPEPREWKLVAPYSVRADQQLVTQVVRALAALEVERRLDGVARADVGLEPARGRVIWRSAKGQGTLEFGGEIPASTNLVVASSESADLLVAGRTVLTAIDRAPGDWRAKEVVTANRESIERIRLLPAGGDELVLARRGDDFVVERPFADAADADRWEPLLSDLASLRAERFLDAPLAVEAESGLIATVGRFELSIVGEAAPLVIEIGAEVVADGPRYARVGEQTLESRTHLDEALARAPEEWRSRHWASFDSWKVERIRIEEPAGKLELARNAGEWRRGGDQIAYTTVGDLLYALNSARASTLLTGAEAAAIPAGSPRLTVVLADGEGAEETLTLYDEQPGGSAARVSGRDVVLILPAEKVAEVDAKLAAVREAEALGAAGAEPDADLTVDSADESRDDEPMEPIDPMGPIESDTVDG